jgi:hypothetical protein
LIEDVLIVEERYDSPIHGGFPVEALEFRTDTPREIPLGVFGRSIGRNAPFDRIEDISPSPNLSP